MPFDPNIPSPVGYCAEMAKPLMDKLFFANKVDAQVIVDFGCADGTMLGALHMLFPDLICVGFDISEAMLIEARKKYPDVEFTSDWSRVRELCMGYAKEGKRNCLVLESMIHEAYSYLSSEELDNFWSKVWG